GLLGCGWTIGGLSAITRVPKTKYHDGKVASVEYTIDDALALDGARLVKVSSDGGSAEFRTENDIYTRIVGYEPTQYGYKYFKATMKDGRTFTFASPDSDGGSFGWPLTEICDANGNYITFQNITSYGGDMNSGIGRVIYGKNKSGAGFETVIEFEFETSPNPVTQYVGGKAVDKWARLGKVRVLGNGFVKTGEYALTYNDGKIFSDRSRLSSISYSRDGVSLGSTNFTWTNNNYCIKSVKDPDLGVIGFWNDFYSLTLGDGKGSGTTDMAYIVKGSPLIICNGLSYDNTIKLNHYNYDNVLFYDVDNDGVQELVTGQSSFMGLQRRIFHSVGKWDGKSQMYVWKVQDKQTLFPSSDADTYSPEDYRVSEIAGDFYGDGNLQYVPMYKKFDIRSASIWKQLLSVTSTDNDNRYGNICKRATGDFPDLRNVSVDPCLAYAVNMNGNAKSDLMCVFKSGAIKFYEENNGVFEEIMKNNLTLGKDDAIYPADFNGDGNTDLIIIRGGTALRAEVYLSTGKEFKLSEIGNTLHLGNSDVLGIIDINSDGRSDVMVSNPNECTLYFSNGHNFIKMVSVPNKTLNPDSSEARRISKFLPALSRIYDGKGGMHFLEYFEGIVEFSPNDIFDKVVKIEDGLHNTINIGYDKIDNFVKPAQASFVPGLYKDVVSTVSRLNSSGKGANLKYEYGDVLYDKDARSFMGYGMVKNTDVNTSRETVSRYSLKNSCVLCDSKVESVNGRIIKSLNNRCNILTNKDGKIHMALLTSQTEIDKLTGAELYTECKNLDAYGNPQKILIKRVGQIVTHEISYVRLLGDKVSKPVSIKTTYSYGGRSETRERSMSYDDNGNITSDTENGIVRRYMDYDVFGNYQTLQYGDGADMRTEKYVYTPSGRHIWNKTNALGEKTVYRWGEVKDRLESEIDAYKRITYYYYDAFGNLTGTYKGSNITSIEKQ
ncbi:MAG: hypothetical protein J6P34_01185, partial [Paludibacteraceae bacterium]|nr:hypothetical protein [Paludibacteraceae bacterium]